MQFFAKFQHKNTAKSKNTQDHSKNYTKNHKNCQKVVQMVEFDQKRLPSARMSHNGSNAFLMQFFTKFQHKYTGKPKNPQDHSKNHIEKHKKDQNVIQMAEFGRNRLCSARKSHNGLERFSNSIFHKILAQ